MNEQSVLLDTDAANKAADADAALQDLGSDQVGEVYVTATVTVWSADRTVAGLLGASPGASTAVPIMIDALRRCFPEQWHATWHKTITDAIPGAGDITWDAAAVTNSARTTAYSLRLDGSTPSS